MPREIFRSCLTKKANYAVVEWFSLTGFCVAPDDFGKEGEMITMVSYVS
jgi:hypothetical protein